MTIFGTEPLSGDTLRDIARQLAEIVNATRPRSVPLRVDAEHLLRVARRVAVAPAVASRVSRDGVDARERELLDAEAARAGGHNALLRAGAAAVVADLARADVPAILLKGAAMLAAGVDADPAARHMDDVDVLVPADAIARAVAALERAGYTLNEKMTRPGLDGRSVGQQDVRVGDHAAPGLVSPLGVSIDLHHRVPHARIATYEALAEHAYETPIGRVPSLELLMAQTCEHVAVHHGLRPKYLPRLTSDLAVLGWRLGDDAWARCAPFAAPAALRAARAATLLVRTPGGDRLLAPSEAALHATELAWEAGEAALRIQRDVRTDPRRIWRKLVPARAFVAASYDVSPDDPRLPAMYLHRLATFRWLTRPHRG